MRLPCFAFGGGAPGSSAVEATRTFPTERAVPFTSVLDLRRWGRSLVRLFAFVFPTFESASNVSSFFAGFRRRSPRNADDEQTATDAATDREIDYLVNASIASRAYERYAKLDAAAARASEAAKAADQAKELASKAADAAEAAAAHAKKLNDEEVGTTEAAAQGGQRPEWSAEGATAAPLNIPNTVEKAEEEEEEEGRPPLSESVKKHWKNTFSGLAK